jgi:hypothetical protein
MDGGPPWDLKQQRLPRPRNIEHKGSKSISNVGYTMRVTDPLVIFVDLEECASDTMWQMLKSVCAPIFQTRFEWLEGSGYSPEHPWYNFLRVDELATSKKAKYAHMLTNIHCLVGHYLHDVIDLLYPNFKRPKWEPLKDSVATSYLPLAALPTRSYHLMTMLREPTDRVRSLYSWWDWDGQIKTILGNSWSEFMLDESLTNFNRKDNYYVRVFCPEVGVSRISFACPNKCNMPL